MKACHVTLRGNGFLSLCSEVGPKDNVLALISGLTLNALSCTAAPLCLCFIDCGLKLHLWILRSTWMKKRQGNHSDIVCVCVCIFPLVEQGGCGHLVASRFDK